MLFVKTRLGPSKINGIGLFANQFIPKGTIIWKFKSGFDIVVDESELSNLSESSREQFLKYAYLNLKTNKYILCFDDTRFFNHSDNPNCINTDSPDDEEGIDIAAEDIHEGEELTCNYKEFDAEYDYKMKNCFNRLVRSL